MTSVRFTSALLLALITGGSILAGDWPGFLGPNANGKSSETNLNLTWSSDGPPLLWELALGSSYAAPVVVGDACIVFHRLADNEVIERRDAATGQSQWTNRYPSAYQDRYGYSDGPRASPLISGKQVFTLGAEGVLSCLQLDDGALVWRRALNAEYEVDQNFFGVGAAPVMSSAGILVNLGAVSDDRQAGVVCLDPLNGKTKWESSDHRASYSSPVVTQYKGREIAIFHTRKGVLILAVKDGSILYDAPFRSTKIESVNASNPVLVGSNVFVSATYGTGAQLLSLGDTSITKVWSSEDALQSHWATSIFHRDMLFGVHGRHESEAMMRCVNPSTGEVVWSGPRGLGRASFILVKDVFIALGERGDLALIKADPKGYKELFRKRVLGHPSWTPPVLANGRLYLRDERRLKCFNLRPQ